MTKVMAQGKVTFVLVTILAFAFSMNTVLSRGPLDLVIPVFRLENVTVEDALLELQKWGILIGFEKAVDPEKKRFKIGATWASVQEILDKLTRADPRYFWTSHTSYFGPWSPLVVINVLPVGRKERPEDFQDIQIEKVLKIGPYDPYRAIQRIYLLIPELSAAYFKIVSPGAVISDVEGSNQVYLSLLARSLTVAGKYRNRGLTVRDVLNEITLRSGVSWKYERVPRSGVPRWTPFQ